MKHEQLVSHMPLLWKLCLAGQERLPADAEASARAVAQTARESYHVSTRNDLVVTRAY